MAKFCWDQPCLLFLGTDKPKQWVRLGFGSQSGWIFWGQIFVENLVEENEIGATKAEEKEEMMAVGQHG